MTEQTVTQPIREFQIPCPTGRNTRSALLSEDANYLAVTTTDASVGIFRIPRGLERLDVPVDEPSFGVAFRRKNDDLRSAEVGVATGYRKGTVRRFDLQKGLELTSFPLAGARAVAYSHCAQFLAAGTGDGVIRVWNLLPEPAQVACQRLQASRGGISGLAFSASTDRLFAATDTGELLSMSLLAGGSPPHPVLVHRDRRPLEWDCYCLATHPTACLAAFGGVGDVVWLVEPRERQAKAIETGVGKFVRGLDFLTNGQQLSIIGETGVEVWNLNPLGLAVKLEKKPGEGRCLTARQYGDHVYVGVAPPI